MGRSGKQPQSLQAFQELYEANASEGPRGTFWTRTKTRALAGLVALSLAGGGLAAVVMAPYTLATAGTTEAGVTWWDELPHSVDEIRTAERTVILDRQGRQFAQVFTENRVNIPFSKMGKNAVNALIATEDARFYEHNGMDVKGIGRAFVNNMLNDDVQGASTITQQLVENLRVQLAGDDPQKLIEAKASSIRGKLEEVRFAQGIEQDHSKDEILEAYLNIVYFGNGAYGIEAAAQRYFSVSAKDLTVPQAATLIAMLKSPTGYDPFTRPKESRQRRDVVMKRMVAEDYLPEARYYKLIKKKTKLNPSVPANGCDDSAYPYYCQLVTNTFLRSVEFGKTEKARQEAWARGGLVITTPMGRGAMDDAQAAVDRALGRNNRVATATASIVPGKGHVVAIAQNRSWGTSKPGGFGKTEIVYADTPSFQVGSTFKPITAAAALEEGFSADTRLNSPNGAFFANLDEPPGGFKNDTRSGYGYINMATAMQYSVNTYFVGLLDLVGVKDVAAMARRLGMKSVPEDLTGREGSLTLGAYESDPIELASVYATLAGRGVACDPVVMLTVTDHFTGEALLAPDGNCHQEISPAIADTVADIMQAPFRAGGTASRLRLEGRRAAGKTGTTNDAGATWFGGFTPQLATAVWVGDPRGGGAHPLYGVYAYGTYYGDVFGGTIAGPVWNDIMESYHRGLDPLWFPRPGGASASMTARIVPNVQGIDLDSAVTTLLTSGFTVKVAKKTGPANPHVSAPGYVMDQSPKGGGKAAYGDTVVLTLTAGSDTAVRVPSTVEELEEATRQRNERTAPPVSNSEDEN